MSRRPPGPARRGRASVADDGSAIVEFVFVAVLMLVPLIYLIVAVAGVQRSHLAVTTAAREAGRAYATAESAEQGRFRALAAARIAYADAGLGDDVRVRFVAAGAGCDTAPVEPSTDPGGEFTVCVIRQSELPAVPSILQGRGITTEARYDVHLDDFR